MKRTILMLALMSTFSLANATGASDNCNGSGSCATGGTTNNTTNQGGTGYGGAGGNAVATSVSSGGNASIGNTTAIGGASNVDVRNSSTNINAVNSSNSNSNTNKSENTNIGINGQQQSTANANNSSNTSNVNVEGDHFESARNPVNTAYAPSIAATANCALAVSGGVSFVGFSGSFGKSYIDQNCVALEKVRSVSQVLGDKETAAAMMCLDETYAKARANIGKPCAVAQE